MGSVGLVGSILLTISSWFIGPSWLITASSRLNRLSSIIGSILLLLYLFAVLQVVAVVIAVAAGRQQQHADYYEYT